jgi:hypothetical protein
MPVFLLRKNTYQNNKEAEGQVKQRNLQRIRQGINDGSTGNPDDPGRYRKNQDHI